MNLTLHLVRKDLRQFRFFAMAWIVLVVAQIVVNNRLLSGPGWDSSWFITTSLFTNLLYFLGMVGAYFLAGVLVLADAPAGAAAFWKTRPVAGGRVLGAKFISCVLLLAVLPSLLWLPWWIYTGFDAAAMARAALNIFVLHAVVALTGAALASVVDEIGRFALLTVILIAGLIVVGLNLIPMQLSTTLAVSRLLLATACVAGASLLVVIAQYRRQRVFVSGGLLLGGLALALLVGFKSPWDISPLWMEQLPTLADTGDVRGRVLSSRLEGRLNKDGEQDNFVTIFLAFSGLPDEAYAAGATAEVELRWADGTVVRRDGVRFPGYHQMGYNAARALRLKLGMDMPKGRSARHWDPETEEKMKAAEADFEQRRAKMNVKGSRPKTWPEDLPMRLSGEISVSPAIAEKIRQSPPECRVVARIRADRPVVLGEAPLAWGARIVNQGRADVLQLSRAVRPLTQNPWGRQVHYLGTIVLAEPPRFESKRDFWVLDRAHDSFSPLYTGKIEAIAPVAARIVRHGFDFAPPSVWRTDRWEEVPGWEKSTTLIEVTAVPVGEFEHTFTTDRLELEEPEPELAGANP
jgi:hypothetical protein